MGAEDRDASGLRVWQASIVTRSCFNDAVVSGFEVLVDYALYASRQPCGTLFGGDFVVHCLRCFVFDREVRDSRGVRHLGSSKCVSSPRPIIHVSFVFRVFVWIFGELLFNLWIFVRLSRVGNFGRSLSSLKYASSPRRIIHVSFIFRVFVWIFGEFLFNLWNFVRLFRVDNLGGSLSSLIIVKPSSSCLRASLGVHYLHCPCFGLSGTTHLVWDLTPILFVFVLSRFGKYPPSCPPHSRFGKDPPSFFVSWFCVPWISELFVLTTRVGRENSQRGSLRIAS